MSLNVSYNPLYATTTGDAIGYNNRSGDNSCYETFRDIYANPTKATAKPQDLVKQAKESTKAYQEQLREQNKLNLADISRSGSKTQRLLATQAVDPNEEIAMQRMHHQAFTEQHPSQTYISEVEPSEEEYQRTHRFTYAQTTGDQNISRRLPQEAIEKHIPGYDGFLTNRYSLGNTYGKSSELALRELHQPKRR